MTHARYRSIGGNCCLAMRKTPNAFPDEIFPDGKVKLLRSDVMLRIVMLPFGQLWYHFVMIENQMGLLYEQLDKLLFEE